MTEEKKIRPLNRLQSVYALRAEVDLMYEGGRDDAADSVSGAGSAASGSATEAKTSAASTAVKESTPATPRKQLVAWVMLEGWAAPILSAMDIRAVFPENYSSLCAAQGKAYTYLDRSDAEGYPTHLCGYARACIGYSALMADEGGEIPPDAPGGGMPKPDLLVASGATCDARFKWFQSLGRFFDAPVWTLESPAPSLREGLSAETNERNTQFLIKELKAFVAFLEKLTGEEMDWERLSPTPRSAKSDAAASRPKDIGTLRWEINEMRKVHPCPMHTRDFWTVMPAANFAAASRPVQVREGFQKMYDEVSERVKNGVAGINRPERYRLAFEGLPPWHSLGFLDQLADRGWNFVCETYYRPFRSVGSSGSGNYGAPADPMERYVRSRSGIMTDGLEGGYSAEEAAEIREEIRCDGLSPRLGLNYVEEYQCDGVFLHVLLTCRATSADLYMIQRRLLDYYKVPSLVIEGDIIDASAFNPAEAMRKAEAFEETMEHYRQVRKDLGMAW